MAIAVVSVCIALQMIVDICGIRQQKVSSIAQLAEPVENAQTIYVQNKENMSVIANSLEDTRTPFTILEVVPHECCSVFPYMIDWGSKESYDANVPIGYEGIVKLVNTLGGIKAATSENVKAQNSLFYTYTYRGMKRETLDNYNVTLASVENDQSANWYRVGENDSRHQRTESGYFLRVQDGKGLYNLYDIINGVTTPGIGLGNYDVKDFFCYMLQKDAEAIAGQWWEEGDFLPVCTEANYVLAFHRADSGYEGEYQYCIKEAIPRDKGAYALDAAYDTAGKYAVSYAKEAKEGMYIRVAAPTWNDQYENNELMLADGYFRLYAEETDKGKKRYDVLFTESITGTYKEQFVYVGEEKGNFDVWFAYTSGTGEYAPEKLEVTLGAGEYVAVAMSRQAESNSHVPSYVETEHGDYHLTVQSVTADVVSQELENAWNWVWVSVDDAKKMDTTLYEEYEKNKDKVGTRIYLSNYTRKYAYYSKYGFVNNEWFKLRCVLSNPLDSKQPYSYDVNATCIQNLEDASELLKTFDANNRIEIISVTPGEVTAEMVDKADLIYFSDKEGMEGMKDKWGWLTGDYSIHASTQFRYQDDITFAIALQIYHKCIVKKQAALMTNMYLQSEDYDTKGYVSKNYEKLFFMINFYADKTVFLEFLESSGKYMEEFSMVKEDGSIVVTHAPDWNENCYNRHSVFEEEENIVSFRDTKWYPAYFIVWLDLVPLQYDPAYSFDAKMEHRINAPSDTYLVFDWYVAGWFDELSNMDMIWEILNNRVSPLNLEITNAALTGNGELVIYVDELDSHFTVACEVTDIQGEEEWLTVQYADSIGTETVFSTAISEYASIKYDVDVRLGFTKPYDWENTGKPLDPAMKRRKVKVTAGTVSKEVWVIVRDMFELN